MTTKAKATPTTEAAPDETAPAENPYADGAEVTHPSLVAALAGFHRELPRVGKDNTAQVKSDKGSYTYRYADLSEISPVVLPLLGRHGLAWSTTPTIDDDGRFVLAYELAHTSGDRKAGMWPLPDPRSTPQVLGSALTYARRYTLCAVTGIAPGQDDDDAQAASQRTTERPAPQARQDRTRAAQAATAQADEGQPTSRSAEAALELLARTCADKGWDRTKVAERYQRETGRALARAAMRDTEEYRKKLLALPDADLADIRLTPPDGDVPPPDEAPPAEGD
ncbi:ERF family protein [Pseudonocardia sp. D17]|uniref:ERF family protein n=1 Tax=Pseudonocardia sp. D17 TaxID=882661 RepID=UPI002B3937FB|nr:hypothetical protein PSD17_56680 [Pseudonocardia sp. D17]